MVKQIALLSACLLTASPVLADSIVTWEAAGQVTGLVGPNVAYQSLPPIGTPVSLTLSFNPDAAVPTPPSAVPGCMMVDVSASVTIGGHTWSGGGLGFTHAALPGANCTSSFNFTQFSLHSMTPPTDTSWDLGLAMSNVFILSYVDQLVQDAFPDVPTAFGASLWTLTSFSGQSELNAGLRWRSVEQTAPVPEPGTLTLVGLGLAAAARARRKKL
ncbi:MAG TPA: PEP-CTERM sorting domain-containing protein [Vicinamibacterales bacterium]|nr:PEP-CTERM sorting domain-containing protein [Vicinamibacterales bacterium]